MKQESKELIPTLWSAHLIALLLCTALLGFHFDMPTQTLYLYLGVAIVLASGFAMVSRLPIPPKFTSFFKLGYTGSLVFVVFLASIHGDNVNAYGPLVGDTVSAILQTDVTEAVGYLSEYLSSSAVLYASIASLVIATTVFFLPARLEFRPILFLPLVLFLLCGAFLTVLGRHDVLLIYREAKAYSSTLSSFISSRGDIIERNGLVEITSDFEGDIVVIMGESTSRHHLGLYGYVRNTTPRLLSRREELFIYEDIISTHSHTKPSFSDAMALNDRQTHRPLNDVVDLITLLKAVGFYTVWLSNQNAIGVWDDPVAAMARQADFVKYHDPASGRTLNREIFDEAMLLTLDQLGEAQEHKRRFTFMHLMATHAPYCGMVPETFARDYVGYDGVTVNYALLGLFFGAVTKHSDGRAVQAFRHSIDCYDRSVRYVDMVLEQAIVRFAQRERPVFLVYTADHGEAPMLNTYHDSRRHSHFHIEVPFVVWVNEAFRKRYPEKVRAIDSNQRIRGSLVDFPYAILDVAAVKPIPDRDKRSMFSPTFTPFSRTTLHRRIRYDTFDSAADAIERVRGNMNALRGRYGEAAHGRVWAHRVNSLAAMLEARPLFKGMELDVVFDNGRQEFFVYHPPVPNIGLSLELYLRQDDGRARYWFDWKNATPDNIDQALHRLEEIDKKRQVKGRVILETTATFKGVGRLAANGWHTSYYTPTETLLKCQKECTPLEAKKIVEDIKTRVEDNKFGAISLDARLLPFYRTYLRKYVQERGLKVYTWNQEINMATKKSLEQLAQYLEDPTIGVVLVNFPSPFDI